MSKKSPRDLVPEKKSSPGLHLYKPFGGKMRFDHSEGVGGLSRFDKVLWLVNALLFIGAIFSLDLLGTPLAIATLATVFVLEAILLRILGSRRRRRLPKPESPPDSQPDCEGDPS